MHLSSHLTDKSKNWDTSWARKYLKIPQDQLEQLENIPGWSVSKSPATEVVIDKETPVVVTQKDPPPQIIAVPEKIGITAEENSSCPKGTEKLKILQHPMDLDFSCSQPIMGSYKSTQIIPTPVEQLPDYVLSHKYFQGSIPTSSKPENEVPEVSQPIMSTASQPVEGTSKEPQLLVRQVEIIETSCSVEKQSLTESHVLNSVEPEIIPGNEAGKIIVEQDLTDKPVIGLNIDSKMCTPVSVVEDSFRCESIPCGQPVNVNVSSQSSRDVSIGEAKSIQEVEEEKTLATAVHVNPGEVKSLHSSPHTTSAGPSTKRKRKSKGDTPKGSKRSKQLKIRFMPDQVKNMLEVLKLSVSS